MEELPSKVCMHNSVPEFGQGRHLSYGWVMVSILTGGASFCQQSYPRQSPSGFC